jgi:hypothetical protein
LLNVTPDGTTTYIMGDTDAIHWWQTATVASQPYLLPAEGGHVCPRDVPPSPGRSASELLHCLIRLLTERGHDILILDQTRPDIGLPVVKTIVPGLRHFWARFAPGRLYDVPVQTGWRQEPITEAELNPTPIFL